MTAIGRRVGRDRASSGINAFASGRDRGRDDLRRVSGRDLPRRVRGDSREGELDAARAVGMSRRLLFRRIIVPQTLRFAIPGLGNVWQLRV
jgi:hypothetical protein